MAFTVQNKSDAYLFFALAFNAAPGSVYGGQIVEAYESGMTTQQIVNVYTTKEQFTKLYPTTQTNKEFATALVNNVVGATATAAVKAQAVTDIEAALTAGLTKGDVIFNVLGNLSQKDTADAAWGKTVQMIANKVAVAKVLTEGVKALNTTDVALLQGPLKGVTEVAQTVQDAINASGDLASKLVNLDTTKKAVTDYAKSIVDKDGVVTTAAAIKDAAVANIKSHDLTKGGANVTDYETQVLGLTGAALTAKQNAIKQSLVSDKDVATAQLTAVQVQVNAVDGLAQLYASNKAAVAAKAAATTEVTAKGKDVTKSIDIANAGKTAADVTSFKVAGVTVTDNAAGPNVLINAEHKLATGVTEVTNPGITSVLNALLAEDAAVAKLGVAGPPATGLTKLAVDAAAALATKDTGGLATALGTAEDALDNASKAVVNFDAALKELAKADGITVRTTELADAVTAAVKAFADAGLKEPVEVTGSIVATNESDIFLATDKSDASTILNFGLQGKDVIYVGKGYEFNTTGDLTKGNDANLEVFFKANGTGTDVYVEQKAFGSSSAATTKDIVKITLTGVAADKIVLNTDGFIALA